MAAVAVVALSLFGSLAGGATHGSTVRSNTGGSATGAPAQASTAGPATTVPTGSGSLSTSPLTPAPAAGAEPAPAGSGTQTAPAPSATTPVIADTPTAGTPDTPAPSDSTPLVGAETPTTESAPYDTTATTAPALQPALPGAGGSRSTSGVDGGVSTTS